MISPLKVRLFALARAFSQSFVAVGMRTLTGFGFDIGLYLWIVFMITTLVVVFENVAMHNTLCYSDGYEPKRREHGTA